MGTLTMPLQSLLVSADHAQLASVVADGASRCTMIVECATGDALHWRAVSVALRSRIDCIEDLAAADTWPDSPALTGEGTSRRVLAVAAALRELNGSIVQATRVVEEGVRLRNSQREIVADIQSSLLRTERQVRGLTRDTNALAAYVSSILYAR